MQNNNKYKYNKMSTIEMQKLVMQMPPFAEIQKQITILKSTFSKEGLEEYIKVIIDGTYGEVKEEVKKPIEPESDSESETDSDDEVKSESGSNISEDYIDDAFNFDLCTKNELLSGIQTERSSKNLRITNILKATKPKLLEVLNNPKFNIDKKIVQKEIEILRKNDKEYKDKKNAKIKQITSDIKVGDYLKKYSGWRGQYIGVKVIGKTDKSIKVQILKSIHIKTDYHDPPYNQDYTEHKRFNGILTNNTKIIKNNEVSSYQNMTIPYDYEVRSAWD